MNTEKPNIKRALAGLEAAAKNVEKPSGGADEKDDQPDNKTAGENLVSASNDRSDKDATQHPPEFKGVEIPEEAFDVEMYEPGGRTDDVALRYSTRVGEEIRRATYYYKDSDSDELLPASIEDRFPANGISTNTQVETEEAEMDTQFRERGDDNIPYTTEMRAVAQKNLREALARKSVDDETFVDLLENINKPEISPREVRHLVWQLKQLDDTNGPARDVPATGDTDDIETSSQEANFLEVPSVIEVVGGREVGKDTNGLYLIKDGGRWRIPRNNIFYTGREGENTVKIRFSPDRRNVDTKVLTSQADQNDEASPPVGTPKSPEPAFGTPLDNLTLKGLQDDIARLKNKLAGTSAKEKGERADSRSEGAAEGSLEDDLRAMFGVEGGAIQRGLQQAFARYGEHVGMAAIQGGVRREGITNSREIDQLKNVIRALNLGKQPSPVGKKLVIELIRRDADVFSLLRNLPQTLDTWRDEEDDAFIDETLATLSRGGFVNRLLQGKVPDTQIRNVLKYVLSGTVRSKKEVNDHLTVKLGRRFAKAIADNAYQYATGKSEGDREPEMIERAQFFGRTNAEVEALVSRSRR